jgi:macrolide transport system ATP-binding/permease protein
LFLPFAEICDLAAEMQYSECGFPGTETLMRGLIQDLRFAVRQLRRAPSFAFTAVLTLAIGIGANTAIFSVVNDFVLRPMPVERPEQLAVIALGQNKQVLFPAVSWPEYKTIREQTTQVFSTVIGSFTSMDGIAMPGHQPQRIITSFVTGNYFSGLGLQPAAGRLFRSSEGEVQGRDAVLVLDYEYWKSGFNGDPSAIGRTVTINGHSMTIVGVAPQGFHGTVSLITPAVYMPVSQTTTRGISADALNDWKSRYFQVFGRLRPGVSLQQASATMGVIARELERLRPVEEKDIAMAAFAEVDQRIPTGNGGATLKLMSALFLALAVMVLLLACVNVANLVLVRATEREREMAIRTALGAKRGRLLRQMITESVLLSLIGGGFGVLLGAWASNAFGHLDVHFDIPLNLDFSLDWRIFLYSFLTALMAGVVVGVIPAVRSARGDVNTLLHEGGRGVTSGRPWFRNALVVSQMAGSLVLLAVAGLFVRSLGAIQTMDLGFRPEHVLNAVVDPTEIGMDDIQTRNLASRILARLQQLGGVEGVSHASSLPLGYLSNRGDTVLPEGATASTDSPEWGSGYTVVSPGYFRVMGIDLLRGRAFSDSDDEHGRDVAIVSESMARKFWPNQDAIGRTFSTGSDRARKLEIVGIARDAEFQIYGGGKTRPFFYLPYAQHFNGNRVMVFQLKTARDPLTLATAVQKAIHDLAPSLPVFQVQSMHQSLYTLVGFLLFQIGAALAAIMGLLGLTLAIVGLYGVVSYVVSRRTHEIGLRIALGADRGALFRMIYRQSLGLIAGGLALGLALALLAAHAASSMVVVSVWDPLTYTLVCSTLAITALASCYFPARRAMMLDPIAALRED